MAATQARARRSIIHISNAGALQAAIEAVPSVPKSTPAPVDIPPPAALTALAPGRSPRPARAPRSAPHALMAAAREAEDRGDAEMAVRILKRVCLVAPRSAAAHDKLAVLLATKLRQFKEACDAAIKAVELEPANMSYRSNMNMMKMLAHVDDNDALTMKGEGGHGLSCFLKRTVHHSLRSFCLASWSLILWVARAAIGPLSISLRSRSSAITKHPTSSAIEAGAPVARASLGPTYTGATMTTLGTTARIMRKANAPQARVGA